MTGKLAPKKKMKAHRDRDLGRNQEKNRKIISWYEQNLLAYGSWPRTSENIEVEKQKRGEKKPITEEGSRRHSKCEGEALLRGGGSGHSKV